MWVDMRRLNRVFRGLFRKGTPVRRRSEDVNNDLYPKVVEVMEQSKAYLDQNFNLEVLTLLVGTNRTYLSHSLKVNGTNFSKFVAEYRCRHVAYLLDSQTESYDVEELVLLSGFPSRRTMYMCLNKYAPDVCARVKVSVKK